MLYVANRSCSSRMNEYIFQNILCTFTNMKYSLFYLFKCNYFLFFLVAIRVSISCTVLSKRFKMIITFNRDSSEIILEIKIRTF